MLLLSIEACYKLVEEVFYYFGYRGKMRLQDYESLVLVIGRFDDPEKELAEARELRAILLAELNKEG